MMLRVARIPFKTIQYRTLFEVGQKIPINYIADEVEPTIKPDSEYPEWVFGLSKPLPSKRELEKKGEKEDFQNLTLRELEILKRRLTTETIKKKNSAAQK